MVDITRLKPGDVFNPYKLFIVSCIPSWLECRTDVSWTAKGLYGRLCRYAGENGDARPFIKSLAREIGVSRSVIDRAIAELKRNRLIRVKRRGIRAPNSYLFLFHEWMVESLDTPELTYLDTPDMTFHDTPELTQRRESLEENQFKREVHASRPILRTDREEIDPLYAEAEKRVI